MVHGLPVPPASLFHVDLNVFNSCLLKEKISIKSTEGNENMDECIRSIAEELTGHKDNSYKITKEKTWLIFLCLLISGYSVVEGGWGLVTFMKSYCDCKDGKSIVVLQLMSCCCSTVAH